MPGVVGIGVQDGEGMLSAGKQKVGGRVAGEGLAEEASLLIVGTSHVCHPPRSEKQVHQLSGDRRSAISRTSSSMKSASGTLRRSSPVRALTETAPAATSRSPTTSM